VAERKNPGGEEIERICEKKEESKEKEANVAVHTPGK